MRVILAGGGTGGHVIPALAIGQKLRDTFEAEVLFIGTSRGIENRLVPAAGFPLKLIEVGALKKVSLLRRLKTLFALPNAVFRAWRLLREFRPQVVIGVGGYASGPAMIAAVLARIPTIAFEPNLVPGFANRVVARLVTIAAVHFEQTGRYFSRSEVTGVPVRDEFFNLPQRVPGQPLTMLVFGGSQGARAINQAVMGTLPLLAQSFPGLHIIHQTGERENEDVQAGYRQAAITAISAEVYPFLNDMPARFAQADLVICRSGASTVAEVAAAGKAAIFVPFPYATDDHQRRNAEALEAAGAAVLIPERELTPERLGKEILRLLRDPNERAKMADAARAMAHPDAAGAVARMAARLAGKGAGSKDASA